MRSEEKHQILMPRALLPVVKEGDILEIAVVRDEQGTDQARERVSSLIEKLRDKAG